MATRASIRFATREEGVSFNEIPNAFSTKPVCFKLPAN